MAENVAYILEIKDRFSRNLTKFQNNLDKAQKKAESLRVQLKKFGKGMADVGKKMTTRLTLPIAAAGAASAFAFAKMETGLVDVLNLMETDEIKKFGGDLENAQERAIKLGFSIDDTNKALFDTVSALGASKESIKVFDVAQKTAIAGAAGLGVTVDGITSIINAYGRETTNAEEVANAFFSAQVKGKTTVADLAANIGKVAPIAKAAGVGFKELLATASALTLGGLSTEEATTALRGALAGLVKPSKDAQKVLKALDVPFGATQIQGVGLRETLERLSKASEKYPDLLARAIPNVRAFTGISALSGDKLKLIDEAMIKMNNDLKNGTGLLAGYNRKMQTLDQRFKMAKGSMTIAAKEIGVVLAPLLIKLANKIVKLTEKFAKLSPSTKKFIVTMAGILAIAGPILIVFGSLISTFASLAIVAGVLGISLSWLFIIPAAIAGVIALIVILQKKFQIFTKIGKAISGVFDKLRGTKGLDINKATEVRTSTTQEAKTTNAVDVSGALTVAAEKGTKVTNAKMFNPDVGMNLQLQGT